MKRSNDDDEDGDSDPPPATFAMIPRMMNDLGQLALELSTLDGARSQLQKRMGNISARLWEHGPAFIVANIEHFAPMYDDKLREALQPIVDFKCHGNMHNVQSILACGGHALVRAGEHEFAVVWFSRRMESVSNAELLYFRDDGDAESHVYRNRGGWVDSREFSNDFITRIVDVLKNDRHTVIELMCKLHNTLEKFHMDPLKVWSQAEARRAAKRAKEQQD